LDSVEFGLNPDTSTGVVTEVYPELRDSALLSFPCFEIETHFIGGMNGKGDPIAYSVVLWSIVRYTY
jgi:hypothetical protein